MHNIVKYSYRKITEDTETGFSLRIRAESIKMTALLPTSRKPTPNLNSFLNILYLIYKMLL
jgi:hypothetical protein